MEYEQYESNFFEELFDEFIADNIELKTSFEEHANEMNYADEISIKDTFLDTEPTIRQQFNEYVQQEFTEYKQTRGGLI